MSEKKKMDAKHLMIIFGCMLLQAIPYGLAQNVPPLFIHYLHTDFSFSLANVGLIFTVGAIASSLVSPFGGKFYAKFSTRLVMTCAMLVSCVGLFMNAFVNSLGMYFLANAIIQIGCVIYSGLGVPYLIGTWFDEKTKAQALGVAFAGGSIGNFFLQPIFANLLHKYAVNSVDGLHHVYLIAAIAALVVGVLVLLFLIRDHKAASADKAVSAEENAKAQEASLKGIGAAAVRKLPAFWILALGMFFIGLNISAQSSQYANYFDAYHVPAAIVGTVGSTFAIACLIGNVGGGVLFAKLGVFHSSLVAFALQFLSCVTMIVFGFTHMAWLGYIWAALYGLTVFIYMSGPAIIIQDLFGMKESSESLGVFSIFFAVGFAIGNVIFGAIVDTMGYLPAWFMTLIFIIIGFTILSMMIKKIMAKNYAHMTSIDEAK